MQKLLETLKTNTFLWHLKIYSLHKCTSQLPVSMWWKQKAVITKQK